jgi:hypothetical protein
VDFEPEERVVRATSPGQRGVIVRLLGICSRGSRPVRAFALVRVGAARVDSDAIPPTSAGAAHRIASLRHRHRAGSLAAVPAHGG